jgi:hypothetical protein
VELVGRSTSAMAGRLGRSDRFRFLRSSGIVDRREKCEEVATVGAVVAAGELQGVTEVRGRNAGRCRPASPLKPMAGRRLCDCDGRATPFALKFSEVLSCAWRTPPIVQWCAHTWLETAPPKSSRRYAALALQPPLRGSTHDVGRQENVLFALTKCQRAALGFRNTIPGKEWYYHQVGERVRGRK